MEANPGEEYMFRERALGTGAITEIFFFRAVPVQGFERGTACKRHVCQTAASFVGEIYMGHLRYSTTGKSGLSFVHPFLRRNNWRAKNLALCGNFNLTNVDEVFSRHYGQRAASPDLFRHLYHAGASGGTGSTAKANAFMPKP